MGQNGKQCVCLHRRSEEIILQTMAIKSQAFIHTNVN